MGDLQHRSGHRPSSLGSIVDRLEQNDIAIRQRSSTDRRLVTIVLTDPGRQLTEKIKAIFASIGNDLAGQGIDLDQLRLHGRALVDSTEGAIDG